MKYEHDSNWDYFYERSIGCVGALKDGLTRSLGLALDSANSILSPDFLERRALSVAQCTKMLSEATIGEKDLEETKSARLQLRESLGLNAELSKETKERTSLAVSEQRRNIKPRKNKQRIGTRKPVRDKIRTKTA